MTTAQTIVTDAYIEARIVDAIDGAESAQLTVGLRFLNRIISRLSAKNGFIPYSTSESFSISSSSSSYTMGSGGTASTTRAKRITDCFVRDSSNNDYPVKVISETDYNSIYDKNSQDIPRALFYDPIYPIGVINFWPKPDSNYTAYIESQKDLHSTLALSDTLQLPGEYEDALVLALGYKLARANGSPNEVSLYQDALNALKSIFKLNTINKIKRPILPFSGVCSSSDLFSESVAQSGFTYTFDFILS